ncbi:cytidine deaminase-like protein [Aspergillus karnatakaensis]|uniref:cytidine deaminase family protein n=1 Tax=Aspergillus karnatakaensis TaxID=1810916 RepID=UPI003CCD3C39
MDSQEGYNIKPGCLAPWPYPLGFHSTNRIDQLRMAAYMEQDRFGVTATELETISAKAIAAKDNALCPYSNFRVGACLLTATGETIIGVNIESASYPVGICAERVAFSTALTAGHKTFKAIAVSSDITPGVSPCGMCRQFMRDFTTPSFPVYRYAADGTYSVRTMGELLPDSLGPDDLDK